MGTKTTDENGQAKWYYGGTGAGSVGFIAVWNEMESNKVVIDDYSPVATTVELSASASSILYGDSITLYADAYDQHGQYIESGTVTFKANGTSIGTGSINGGRATLTTRDLGAGSQSITAEIGSAVSNTVNVNVIKQAITMELWGADSFSTNTSSPFTYTGQVFVKWGDNTSVEEYTGGTLSHTYSSTNVRTIKVYGDITGLADSFIYDVRGLRSIVLSDGITSLGDNCIEYCGALREITLPTTLTSIGYRCVFATSVLTSITLPNSLSSLGEACFALGTALTEIVLEWDTASSIVTYDSSWIGRCSSFDHFLIPEGTTALYTAKNYPSNLLQEAGDTPVPDSIDFTLTAGKQILSYADVSGGNEYATLTATVYDEDDNPLEGVDVNLYNGSTLWDTLTTGSDGTVSKTYTSQGSGNIVFTAEVDGTLLTKTYTVHDYWKYIASGSKTVSTTSHTQFNIADLNDLTGNYEISVTMKSNATKSFGIALNNATATSNQNLFRIGVNSGGNVSIVRMGNGSVAEGYDSTTTYTANTDVVLKLTRVNGVYTAYIDSFSHSYSNAPSNPRYLQLESWTSSKTLTYTDFIVKPL